MNRVAVLGATGCVGRQVCAAFTRNGDHVLAVAREYADHVAAYDFRSIDLGAEPPERIAGTFADERVDVVVNATGGWGTTEHEMRYAHVQLVERLVEAMALVPSRPRLVHVGTIHEYGPVIDGTLIDENTEPAPETLYARTKLAGSEAVLRAARADQVNGVVLRSVNMCGPHPPGPSFLGFLRSRLREAATDRSTVELTIAPAKRDYVDVRDVAEAVALAARAPVAGQVINIGSAEATEMRDLVTRFVTAAGFPPDRVRFLDNPVLSKGGDWTRADIRLAGKLLNWHPRISLPDSLRATWESEST
ncbi:NAD-dependent epimerase [Prauserella marina]|uniref:NAD-dependent epimerase/dehydratase family protein n=1 Tax=Prauserella marina TaxID=530584 RepID=UPI000B89A994|nr:NAD(P)-dependent oxidoreductase [Prauserella marina]ASR39075.1 NAD-dependent epimerase [Prauserella marina]